MRWIGVRQSVTGDRTEEVHRYVCEVQAGCRCVWSGSRLLIQLSHTIECRALSRLNQFVCFRSGQFLEEEGQPGGHRSLPSRGIDRAPKGAAAARRK